MQPTSLPIDKIQIASPCTANWDEMVGDNKSRFCGQCQLNVYNLSAMQRPEIEKLFQNKQGRLCVRFYLREDGTMLTQDCPVGLRKLAQKSKERLRRLAAVCAGVLSTIIPFAGCSKSGCASTPKNDTLPTKVDSRMGDVAELPTKKPTPTPGHLMGEMVAPEVSPTPTMPPKMGKPTLPEVPETVTPTPQ